MKELEFALMDTGNGGLSQLPVRLVRINALDDANNAWFVIPRPSQQTGAIGETMSVTLTFYKKGKPFYLRAQGQAAIVTQMADVPDTDAFQSLRTMLWKGAAAAVKVRIEETEIFGEPEEKKQASLKGVGATLISWYEWLFAPVIAG